MNNEKALRHTPGLLTILALALVLTLGIILYPMRVQAAAVVGATVTDEGEPNLSYIILTVPEGSNAGTVKLSDGSNFSVTGGFAIPQTITVANTSPNGGTYTVVEIGDRAFGTNANLEGSLSIPSTVTSIGEQAFYMCTGLTGDLTIPNSVTHIGEHAFAFCGFDGNLTLSSNLTFIGESAFAQCKNFIGDLTIPDSLTSIEESVFTSCGFDGNLTLSSNLTSIGNWAFECCYNLDGDLTIPDSLTSIGDRAFSQCYNLDGNLTFSSNLTSIGEGAFLECYNLDGKLTIPSSVTSIGKSAFYDSTFTEVDSYVDSSVMADAFLAIQDYYYPHDFSGFFLTCPKGSSAGYIAIGFIKEQITERSDAVAPGTDDQMSGNETGNSKGKQKLPPYAAFGKEWADLFLSAEEGESVKLRTDLWVSFPGYVMEALAARRDLTLELTYKYEGVWYQTIIPAGAEVPTGVPYAGFYGYLGGMYGRTVVE